TQPNEVWSWDITKLLGPCKWSYFYLYVIIDIYSRYVVSWLVADRESAELANQLIEHAVKTQGIDPGRLTLHADRGASMKSKPVAQLLADLGVTKSHSRPHTSDDNPFSEAQFKTLKYQPHFPARFGCIEDARDYCRRFFTWYNHEHRHTGIVLLTPKALHPGQADDLIDRRQRVLDAAYERTPERFPKAPPRHPSKPSAVWINPPTGPSTTSQDLP
ncbi:MAG: transposase, partial [Rhodocyclaceae bacterium]|nr:transposase [Rhodocyclaceae bacterium]